MQTTYSITEGLENDFQIWGSKTCEGGCFWCCFCCTDGQSALRRVTDTDRWVFFQSFRHFQSRQSHEASDLFSQMGVAEDLAWSLEVSLGSKASPVMRFPCHKGAEWIDDGELGGLEPRDEAKRACSVHFVCNGLLYTKEIRLIRRHN